MDKTYILYNPHAGNGKAENAANELALTLEGAELVDMTKVESYVDFFEKLDGSDDLVLCGGDGTLNRFVNDTRGIDYASKLYYYAIGSGNDFARDLGKDAGAHPNYTVNEYVKDLPTVSIKSERGEIERLFINGVGYGIDGYCCEVGDAFREKNERDGTDKPINYTSIAIKGLLFGYKPTSATVSVDGKQKKYKKVWIAPTMNGRYYGGGMMPTPEQKRLGEDGERCLSLMIFHDSSKLKTLMIFPSIFKGEHVKKTKHVEVLCGKEITVEFDAPRALQIDGETVLGVTSYTAKVSSAAKTEIEKSTAAV